ncbi:DUF554 family protein [Kytococcus sp. Marseille-QA3725]
MGAAAGDVVPVYAVDAVTAAGGLLLVGIALGLLRIRSVPVGDLLPALLVAPVLAWGVSSLFRIPREPCSRRWAGREWGLPVVIWRRVRAVPQLGSCLLGDDAASPQRVSASRPVEPEPEHSPTRTQRIAFLDEAGPTVESCSTPLCGTVAARPEHEPGQAGERYSDPPPGTIHVVDVRPTRTTHPSAWVGDGRQDH